MSKTKVVKVAVPGISEEENKALLSKLQDNGVVYGTVLPLGDGCYMVKMRLKETTAG